MVRKLYTDKEYSDKACEANALSKKLIKVQEEREYEVTVLEWEKKTIEVPIYNEEGEIVGYKNIEVDDYTKPIMIEIVDPVTGEKILVQKSHQEVRTEIVEYLEIVDNPENFERCFFETSLGYVKRKAFVKGTGEFKDFLSDMLAGMVVGQPILVYDRDLNQRLVNITAEFKQECAEQYNRDFYGEVENADTTNEQSEL